MAVEITGLLIANVAYALVGVAALAAAGWLTWPRAGVAYPLGLVIVVVPASYLALLRVPVAWTATLVGMVVVGVAAWRTRARRQRPRLHAPSLPRISPGGIAAAAIGLLTLVFLLYAARTFAVRPLIDWDSWAIWAAKGKLLYEDPSAAPAALRTGNYGQSPYPLAIPTLQALGFGAMGQFDGTTIGVQFVLLAFAFPVALWSLLRARARSWVIALTALVIVGSPQILYQLLTHYADVPLGLFIGLGLAAGGAWLAGAAEPWLLGCFAAFLGFAGVTKSEGFLYALVAALALLAGTLLLRDRARLVQCAVGVAVLLAIVLPWRIYCIAYGLSTPDYNLNRVTDISYIRAHSGRTGPVVHELWRQLDKPKSWGWLTWVILIALLVGIATARWSLLVFAGGWLAASSVGLLVLYIVSNLSLDNHLTNTSYRTIVSLLVGGTSLVPLFVFPRRAPPASEQARLSR